MSTNDGIALAGSNCDNVFYGTAIGLTVIAGRRVHRQPAAAGRPVAGRRGLPQARVRLHAHAPAAACPLVVARAHRAHVEPVPAARHGGVQHGRRPRAVGDAPRARRVLPDAHRARSAARSSCGSRRARRVLWVLLVPAIAVTVGVAVTYGQTRFRAAAEPSLAILAAVGVLAVGVDRTAAQEPRRQGDTAYRSICGLIVGVAAAVARTRSRRRCTRRGRRAQLREARGRRGGSGRPRSPAFFHAASMSASSGCAGRSAGGYDDAAGPRRGARRWCRRRSRRASGGTVCVPTERGRRERRRSAGSACAASSTSSVDALLARRRACPTRCRGVEQPASARPTSAPARHAKAANRPMRPRRPSPQVSSTTRVRGTSARTVTHGGQMWAKGTAWYAALRPERPPRDSPGTRFQSRQRRDGPT